MMICRRWFRCWVSALVAAALGAQQPSYPPGVTAEVHAAIQSGLKWLSKNQAKDGS